MHKITLLLVAWLCLTTTYGQASHSLTAQRNDLRAGDVIIKQQLEFKDPGATGPQITWDFTQTNALNDKYQLIYFKPTVDTAIVVGREHQTEYSYLLKSDTLWMLGYTNRTTEMTYQQPEALLRFPLQYGDTMRSAFAGTGLYCQRIDLRSEGHTKVTVDGYGKLITPDGDSLQVVRVLRVKDFSNIGVDSVQLRMENYQWYALGIRYPVFESIKTFTIMGDSVALDFATSFYYSSINREQLATDLANAQALEATNPASDMLINCTIYPNPVHTDLQLTYELTADAQVSFLLCDMSGRPWASVAARTLRAGAQQQHISMSGLICGNYTLYITVNNKTYRRNIIKAN